MKRKMRDDENETMGESNLIDIACEVRVRTAKAVLLFDGGREAWVPLSQCQLNDDGTVTMPEFIAMDRGFI